MVEYTMDSNVTNQIITPMLCDLYLPDIVLLQRIRATETLCLVLRFNDSLCPYL